MRRTCNADYRLFHDIATYRMEFYSRLIKDRLYKVVGVSIIVMVVVVLVVCYVGDQFMHNYSLSLLNFKAPLM